MCKGCIFWRSYRDWFEDKMQTPYEGFCIFQNRNQHRKDSELRAFRGDDKPAKARHNFIRQGSSLSLKILGCALYCLCMNETQKAKVKAIEDAVQALRKATTAIKTEEFATYSREVVQLICLVTNYAIDAEGVFEDAHDRNLI